MANTIEMDELKQKKRKKVFSVIGIVAAALVLVWTVYSVATNLNKSERMVTNAFLKVYFETKEPATNRLLDCSKIYEGQTTAGAPFQYVIASIEQNGEQMNCILVVDGQDEGKYYTPQTLSRFDCVNKDKLEFAISERDDNIHLKKMQNAIEKYWKFHDVA